MTEIGSTDDIVGECNVRAKKTARGGSYFRFVERDPMLNIVSCLTEILFLELS